VKIAPVEEENVHRRAGEGARGFEAGEARADDYDSRRGRNTLS
jgi:hypothetical protein